MRKRLIKDIIVESFGGIWGTKPEGSDLSTKILRSTNITKDNKVTDLDNVAKRHIPEKLLSKYLLQEGDIIITKSSGSSDHIGKSILIDEFLEECNYSFANFMQLIRVDKKEILPEYLFLYISNQTIRDKILKESTTTTGLRNLKINAIMDLEIPLPSILEQKQIVSKIKECFTLLDKSEAKLKNAETKSKIFLDSILKKNLDINSAKVVEIDEIATLINGDRGKNYPNKSALVKSGIPFITAGHIQNHKIDYVEMNYITEERYEILNNGKIQKDDILFCLRGSLGKVAIVEDTNKGAIASSLVIIRPNTDIMSKYLYYYLLSQYGQNQIREYDNGTAQPNLSASNLKKFIIRVPEIDKQKEIIKQVEQLSSIIDTIKRNLLMQRDTYSNLRQSILKKAFEGKLI